MTRIGNLLLCAAITGAAVTGVASPAQAASCMQFTRIQYDSPGADTRSNTSLNNEHVGMKNACTRVITMSRWQLRDKEGHVYVFPATKVSPGKTIYVHTGSGVQSSTHRYWGSRWYVWTNTGDRARLWNGAALVDECSWDPDRSGYKNC